MAAATTVQPVAFILGSCPSRAEAYITRAPVSIDPLQLPKVLIAHVRSVTTYGFDNYNDEHDVDWRRAIPTKTLWPQSVVS